MAESEYKRTVEESIIRDLECNVCFNLLNDPYCCPRCKKLGCRKCIIDWLNQLKTCPFCTREPVTFNDFVQAEKTICNALNQLFVKCKKCGQSDVHRDQLDDHLKRHCSGIILFKTINKRENLANGPNDIDLDVPIMAPSQSPTNHLIAENRQLKEQICFQKTIIDRHNEQIKDLMKQIQIVSDQTNQINKYMKRIEEQLKQEQDKN